MAKYKISYFLLLCGFSDKSSKVHDFSTLTYLICSALFKILNKPEIINQLN